MLPVEVFKRRYPKPVLELTDGRCAVVPVMILAAPVNEPVVPTY
jgi:hypothetical protein